MNDTDGSPRRTAFLRLLPARAEVIGRRLDRFAESGWDINGLALIHADAERLRAGSEEHGVEGPGEPLEQIAALLDRLLVDEQLPDAELGDTLRALGRDLLAVVPPAPPPDPEPEFEPTELEPVFAPPAPAVAAAPTPMQASADAWGDDVKRFAQREGATVGRTRSAPITQVSAPAPAPVARPAPPPAAARAAATATVSPLAAAANMPAANGSEPGRLQVPADFRIYHLSACGPLALDLSQRFESQGLDVELLEDADELNELLGALPADLVLIDPEFCGNLENIGATVRMARGRNSKQRLLLVALADGDDITLRLSARRAGVDALLVAPADAGEVLRRLQALVDPQREESFRILIVEDDRSQALFAEGILRNAGMDSLVVIDALDVMPALRQFRPDLVLMDLNMPGANGIELTALIREQEAFAHTPIVFLSGESSEDLQFDAIDAGGDDFLSKPIRPRHLISAVQTRVRRHRQLESRRTRRPDKDAATGLVYRKTLLEQLDRDLAEGQQVGGLIFFELENLSLLRERIGLTALEILLGDVARLLTQTLGEQPATRFGDGSFLVLDRQREDLSLDSLATQVRQILMQTPFQALGHPLRLRLSAGVAAFKHGFRQSDAMINAVEKVAREARTHERGVRRYEPPRATETLKEQALEALVREAIADDSLVLLYQPVVAVAGSDLSQYQTLLRLRDPSGQLRPAAEIVPMAERSSLIVDIDRWVMSQALALIQVRRSEGEQLRLFVTQSALTLAAPDQAEWLAKEIRDAGVPGDCVVIELRIEDVAVHLGTVKQFCETVAIEQVRFCLSQFEAGRDAESLVDQLPLTYVKLARKYTAGALSPAARDELKAMIDRVHRHGLQVIGHGVEDAQAAATLWMSGIDFIQGNLVQQADPDTNFDFHQAVL
jgi:EAL domain-containing protein (putative c-di-GMP-specific phosphodiesterase class I)/PleD family two-component response regulator